jgi:hypothetical protein
MTAPCCVSERMASPGGMLPEKVWDAAPIPGFLT